MLLCVRTTLEINDQLFRQLRKRAADDGAPLRRVVEAALQLYLSPRPPRHRYRLRWRPESGRLLPGVRLEDRNSLLDILDGRR